ncbi:protoporphyrinogen oxidase [Rhodobacterales bacterium HKCCSP123]|nr:protoporphyrinogen oxidase [Rhodobacterales bacterium HKCCSP123]
MKLLVGYASTQGQTRKIARHVADLLADRGHAAELMALEEAEGLEMARFDRAVLAASVHIGHYQASLVNFAETERAWLNAHPVLFLSVSLAAAGHDAEEWRALDGIAADMAEATGWTPSQVVHVAGAYAPSRYDVFTRFTLRRIIAAKDPEADLSKDKEYTDWAALDAAVAAWLAA